MSCSQTDNVNFCIWEHMVVNIKIIKIKNLKRHSKDSSSGISKPLLVSIPVIDPTETSTAECSFVLWRCFKTSFQGSFSPSFD